MEKQKKILYHVNITAKLVCLLFSGYAFYVDKPVFGVLFFLSSAVYAISILLIRKNKFTASYFISIITADILLFVFDTGFNNSYDNSFMLYIPLLLFTYTVTLFKQYVKRIILVSFTAICIFCTNFTPYSPRLAEVFYDHHDVGFIKGVSTLASLLLSWFVVHAIVRLARGSESELRIKKERLRQSQELLNSINKNITQGLYRFKTDGTILYVNPAFVSLFGYKTRPEIMDMSAYKLFEDATHQDNFVRIINKIDSVHNQEMKLLRKDGSSFWGLISCTRVQDESGEPCFDGVVIDISEIKEIESQLILAKELAEDSLHEKSRFLSIMSHEIRTPLNTIVNVSNLLKEGNEHDHEQIEMLNFSSQSLMGLVDNILDFNKIDSGKLQMENSVFDLAELLRNLAARFEPEAKRKNIELSFKFDPAVPELLIGDSGRIGQILINLLTNALKFTENGKVLVSVTLASEINGASSIRFTVTDTGIGIAKDLLPHIFDPFVQAHNQITRKHDGSGLGLWITKMLLQLMNSSISVFSIVGKGAEFSFVLTLPKASAMVDSTRMINDLSEMRILLVEDNVMNIKVVTTFLQRWNAKVDIANNGMEAVALHKSKKYDLILMDIHMPEMNGYQATEIIRDTDKKIPIIALTADAFDESRERAIKAGMNDFVTKPFNPEYLFSVIVKYSLILILLNSPILQTESGSFVKSLLKQIEGKHRDEENPQPNNQS